MNLFRNWACKCNEKGRGCCEMKGSVNFVSILKSNNCQAEGDVPYGREPLFAYSSQMRTDATPSVCENFATTPKKTNKPVKTMPKGKKSKIKTF